MNYRTVSLIINKKIIVLFILPLVLAFILLILGKGYASAGGQGNASLEDGSTYPTYVIDRLNGFCSSGQRSAQTTWLSLANNLAAGSTTVPSGASVELSLNVVTKRCRDGVPTQLIADRFRAKGGVYFRPGSSVQNSIPQLNTVDDIIIQPPAPNGPAYARGSWTFTVSTVGVTTSGDFTIFANSKQYSWREVPAYFMCIMGAPQIQMWGNGNPPPGTTEQSALDEMERVCPVTTPEYTFRVNVQPAPQRNFDVNPRSPVINLSNSTVTFEAENRGDGVSRFTGGLGVAINTTVWVNGVARSNQNNFAHNRAVIAANGGTWSASRGSPYVYNLGQLNPGDIVCAEIRVNPSTGVTDGPLNNSPRSAGGLNSGCQTLTTRPYFRVYGGDVVVGRPFETTGSCNKNASASIRAYTNGSNGGSGVQFAASAAAAITDFLSASMRSGDAPTPPGGLTLGNVASPLGSDGTGYTGCIPNYLQFANDNNALPWPGSGSIPQTGGIYSHNGDITINSDIELDEDWGTGDAPQLYVIVRGNINIAPNVRRLDGVYVAQGGTINTCAGSYSLCDDNQLVVNGSFIANKVLLNRTRGDVSGAPDREPSSSTNAAEVFNFGYEAWLAPPGNSPSTSDVYGEYDSIVGLPPVL